MNTDKPRHGGRNPMSNSRLIIILVFAFLMAALIIGNIKR